MRDSDQAAGNGAVSVSVILPTYNRATLLSRSIGSVLVQTFEDFELIVVDDGSGDDTADVVKAIGDPRVRYVPLGRNRGLSAARNAGLAEARGEFLAFQDSDDEWHPEKLERQLQTFRSHPEAAVVYGDMLRRLVDGQLMYLRSPDIVRGRLVNPATRFWQTYMLAMQPALVRRTCVREEQFDESFALFEDLDLHLRLAMKHGYVHLPEPLVTYHETQGLTSDGSLEFRARRQLLRKYRGSLLSEDLRFLMQEHVSIALRRSLMPIVRQHLKPL
jgi:glycosyltransferase involved in cell wall biosynthesis